MASESAKVFISYNRADRDWAEWIAEVIGRAGYQPLLQAWHFRPGENFVLRMQEAAAQADFTVAVLSEDYLKSEYTQPEWAAAFAQDPTGKKRGLIPVRVAECALTGMLSAIIYIDLFGLSEPEAEGALVDGLKPSGKPAQARPFPGRRREPGVLAAAFPPDLARLYGVPELPPHYLAREAYLGELKQKLLDDGGANVGITGQSAAVGVQGMGGIGKTVLATALAHDPEVRKAFPEGIFWLTVGQVPNVLGLQGQLVSQLTGVQPPAFVTVQQGKDALREALARRRALVVLDDVWAVEDADVFWVDTPPARLLITTRNNEVLVGLGAEQHQVDALAPDDALRMLAEWMDQKRTDALPPEAAEVARECGYLPLALAMVGAMARLSPTGWPDALTRLKRADLAAIKRAFPGYRYPDLLRSIEVSVEALEGPDRGRYLDLAVFPQYQPIPEGTLGVLWNLDEVDTRDCMTRFVMHSLATWVTGKAGELALLLHDLQYDFIYKRREKALPGLHLRLVEAWEALPKLSDAYAWRWIAYHLTQAGHKDDLRQLLLNFSYLQGKLLATDASALIVDYDPFASADEELRLLQSALRLSADVLAQDGRQLAGQLIGRLLVYSSPGIQTLLKQASEKKAWPWLRPLQPTLTAPAEPLIRTLAGHTGMVTAVAVSADGRRALSAADDGLMLLWDLESGQCLSALKGHTGRVDAVALTADGRRALSGSDDRTLRVWDLESGQCLRTLEGHMGKVTAVAVTSDGYLAVSGDWANRLRVWDVGAGQYLRTLGGHGSGQQDRWLGHVNAVALTADGRRALSAPYEGPMLLWDLESGQCLRTLIGHTFLVVQAVALTADGRRALSAPYEGPMLLCDLESGQYLSALKGHTGRVDAVALTADGRRALSGSDDRTLRVWDLESSQNIATFTGENGMSCCAITPNGRTIIAGDRSGRVHFLDLIEADEAKAPSEATKLVLLHRSEQATSATDS